MSDLTIVAEPREVVGKKVKELRRDGLIPAVMYGSSELRHIQVNDRAVRTVFRNEGTASLYNLELEGKKYNVLLKDMQRHVTRGDILHMDFYAVDMSVKVTQVVPLVEINSAPVLVANKGFIDNTMREIEIEALPDALVTEIQVDISMIAEPSDVIRVKDLNVPDGVEFTADPEGLVAKFTAARLLGEEMEEGEEGEEAADAGDEDGDE